MRTLALAYACEPDKGSEPGAGWNMVRLLARLGPTTVVTRVNNRASIEAVVKSVPEAANLHFVFVDLPRWASWWKKGHRGVRLYYLLWQGMAAVVARRLHAQRAFDVCWHVTIANAWLGSTGPLVGPRFVYGPVGAGVRIPKSATGMVGRKGLVYERARDAARWAGRHLNPLARLAWSRASLILAQNPETKAWLPRRHRPRCVEFSNAIIDVEQVPRTRQRDNTALFAARLLAWKGGEFVIRALAELPSWRLIVCGDGPDLTRLQSLARSLGVTDRVDWRGWVPRSEVETIMRAEADVFLLPSLHDEGSAAVVEALFSGLPVVCLRLGGPAVLVGEAGVLVPPDLPPGQIVARIARALEGELPSPEAVERRCRALSFDARSRELREVLTRAGLPVGSEEPAA
jgi:glycosyltransferase involved in cell wall biosynthesis